jgi:hypothetical protein
MNSKDYRDLLDSAAAESLSRNPDLWPDIQKQIERNPKMTTLQVRPMMAVLLAGLILLALSGVVYALGTTLGYIPGVGMVDQSAPVLVLPAPVTVERAGLTVTVSQVVADATRTYVAYRVDGIPFIVTGPLPCSTLPQMRLPDGGTLEATGGGQGIPVVRNGDSMSYAAEYLYTPIQNGGSRVTFALDCVLLEGPGAGPWEMALELVPAPEGYATPATVIAAPAAGDDPDRTGLHLEQVLEVGDSYVLIGKFVDGGDLGGPLYMSTASDSEYLPRIIDAQESPVAFEVRSDMRPDPEWDVAYYWAYEIPKTTAAPVTITLDEVKLRRQHTAQTPLAAGEAPQAGQVWEMGLPVRLGASEFVLEMVTFLGNGYRFELTSGSLPEGVTPWVDILDAEGNVYPFEAVESAQEPDGDRVRTTIALTTEGQPPAGDLAVRWSLEEYTPAAGPWSVTWSPPAGSP